MIGDNVVLENPGGHLTAYLDLTLNPSNCWG